LKRLLLGALAVCFFCSGLSALIYQVLWLRMLGWVFGVTIYAASAVWAIFMAGLALGSIAAGLAADRVGNPFRWFGVTEMLIGITAVATPPLLGVLQRFYVSLFSSFPESANAVTAARLALAFALLIVPTALMGATLPLVIKASTFRASSLRGQVGLLYGSNAAGAIVGTLLAGLYLIPALGIHRTFIVAAGLNLVVGASAIVLSSRVPRLHAHLDAHDVGPSFSSGVTTPSASPSEASLKGSLHSSKASLKGSHHSQVGLRVVLVVFALSGFVSLALEVVWFRVLTLFLRPTVYGFSVMLAMILAGISLGSYLITPFLAKRLRWMTLLAGLELAIGIAIVLSFRPLIYLNAMTARLAPSLAQVMPEYLVYPIAGSLLAIFPTALLMGVAFPIGLYLWAAAGESDAHTAERVGVFYTLNVAGAIAGSLVGGFILLPRFGSAAALVLLASISFASGLMLLAMASTGRAVRAAIAVAAAALFIVAIRASPDPFVQFTAQRFPGMRPVWQEEGVEATVFVHEFGGAGGAIRRQMTVNGVHQAATDYPTTHTHRRIGHLPMIVHPSATRALVIGLGGGATAGAVSIHEGAHVDVVELAESVVHGARLFEEINYGILTRPNVTMRIDDARNYMMLTRDRYDVITADVIQPIYAGSGNLYSVEYFTLMRNVLKPGGLVMQWIPGTEEEYKLIARTFLSVFPESTAWFDGSLLLGSVDPLRLRRSDFDWKLTVPGRAMALHDVQIDTFDALVGSFVAGPAEIRTFVGDGPLLTDDRPLAEYFLSLPRDRQPDLASLRGDVRQFVVPD
jgi:spermidine synthase